MRTLAFITLLVLIKESNPRQVWLDYLCLKNRLVPNSQFWPNDIFASLRVVRPFWRTEYLWLRLFCGLGKTFKICDETSITLAKVWYFSKDGMLMMDRKTCQNMSVNCAILCLGTHKLWLHFCVKWVLQRWVCLFDCHRCLRTGQIYWLSAVAYFAPTNFGAR